MKDINGKGTKSTLNLTIDSKVKKEMKKLVPNISYWVEEQMRIYLMENKKN